MNILHVHRQSAECAKLSEFTDIYLFHLLLLLLSFISPQGQHKA